MDAKPEPPAPARRPGRIGTTVSVLVLFAALSALLVLWSPWSGADGEPRPDESVTGQRSPSADEPVSPGRSDDERPTDGAGVARVPTVIGMPVRQAAAEVEREFDDVRLVAKANGAGEACVVFAQDPESGEYPKSTRVTLTYAGTRDECMA